MSQVKRNEVAAQGSKGGAGQHNRNTDPELEQGTTEDREHHRSRDSKSLQTIRRQGKVSAGYSWVEKHALRWNLRDIGDNKASQDLKVMVCEVSLKDHAEVLDILRVSWKLDPLPILTMKQRDDMVG